MNKGEKQPQAKANIATAAIAIGQLAVQYMTCFSKAFAPLCFRSLGLLNWFASWRKL